MQCNIGLVGNGLHKEVGGTEGTLAERAPVIPKMPWKIFQIHTWGSAKNAYALLSQDWRLDNIQGQ